MDSEGVFFLIRIFIILMRIVLQILAPLIILSLGIALVIIGLFQIQYPLIFQFLLFLFLGLFFISGIVLLMYLPDARDFLSISAWFMIVALLFFFFASFTYVQLPDQKIVIVTRGGVIQSYRSKDFNIKIRPFGSKIKQTKLKNNFHQEGESLPFILSVL